MRASEYTIYKTKAAARFKIAAPDREFQLGCVMLNMSRAVGEKQYDWENKIAVKLGVNDVTNLLFGIVGTASHGKYGCDRTNRKEGFQIT